MTQPLKWPKSIRVGAVETTIEPATSSYLRELLMKESNEPLPDESHMPIALYDSEEMRILFREDVRDSGRGLIRKDIDICHEIVHLWEDLLLANDIKLDEINTQGIALALHQLLVQMAETVEGGDSPVTSN